MTNPRPSDAASKRTAARPTEMVERMRAVASGSTRAASAKASAAESAAPSTRQRPVRYTIDLTPEQHHFLKRASLDLQADASAIVRALLTHLETDAELRARIGAEVERRY